MAEASGGYPFMIQLLGARAWRVEPDAPIITMAAAEEGIVAAQRRLGSLVHEPALAAASDIDKSYLVAMALDDGPSRVATIAERLGVSANFAGQYRLRLIAAELIEPAGRGRVAFALPYLRDYLREHVAADLPLPDRGSD